VLPVSHSRAVGALVASLLLVAGCGGEAAGAEDDREQVFCVDETGKVVDDSKCDDDGSGLGGG